MADHGGKVALVTGAASGIGAAVCRRLAAEGASVLVTDINADGAELLAKELGPAAIAVVHDVTQPDSWTSAVTAAEETFGGFQLLVNNAGIVAPLLPCSILSPDEYLRVVMVNQYGPFLGMQASIPAMAAAGGGAVVNVASTDGHQGMPLMTPYVAAKHALIGMTKSAALELAASGIRVNTVSPGGVDTPLMSGSATGGLDVGAIIATTVPMARLGRPEEIAAAVSFLLSDDASYITGADIVVDGGMICGMSIG
jgi:3alpha(or 20beta)-hydroxysteroid dehydrogenase